MTFKPMSCHSAPQPCLTHIKALQTSQRGATGTASLEKASAEARERADVYWSPLPQEENLELGEQEKQEH